MSVDGLSSFKYSTSTPSFSRAATALPCSRALCTVQPITVARTAVASKKLRRLNASGRRLRGAAVSVVAAESFEAGIALCILRTLFNFEIRSRVLESVNRRARDAGAGEQHRAQLWHVQKILDSVVRYFGPT